MEATFNQNQYDNQTTYHLDYSTRLPLLNMLIKATLITFVIAEMIATCKLQS
jgi:hypothetical protein